MIRKSKLRRKLLVVSSCVFFIAALPLIFLDYFHKVNLIESNYKQTNSIMVKALKFDAKESIQTGIIDPFKEKARFYVNEIGSLSAIELKSAKGDTLAFVANDELLNAKTNCETIAVTSGSHQSFTWEKPTETTSEDVHIGTLLFYSNKSEHNAALKDLFQDTIVLFILMLTVCFISLLVINHYIYQPLHKIFLGLYEIKIGNFSHRIETVKADELGDLSTLVNSTAEVLEKNHNHHAEILDLKNKVLQIAAHEIRTPILTIRQLTDMAKVYLAGTNTISVSSVLNQIFSSVDHLDQRVTAILGLSALENNSLVKKEKSLDVYEFFNKLDKQFQVKCKSKSNLFWSCFAFDKVDSPVVIDEELVYVIISNAVDNAIKNTNHGFVKVSFSCAHSKLTVIVHDSGVGMPVDQSEILKTNLVDQKITPHRKKDGWGIGMHIMYSFCEFLGGNISIDSKQGLGTKLTLVVPVSSESIEQQIDSTLLALPQKGTKFPGIDTSDFPKPKIRILVIDNDVCFLNRMRTMLSGEFLRRDDIDTVFCDNPEEGIILVEENEFDLIMVDYHMPKLNGHQFLKFVAGRNLNGSSLIVIVTADAMIPSDVRRDMLSVARIMSKGLTAADIKSLIRELSLRSV